MQAILMETGLADAALQPAGRRASRGRGLARRSPATGSRACSTWSPAIEQGLRAFGRRNRSLRDFLAMAYTRPTTPKPDPRAGLLPLFLIEDEGREVPVLHANRSASDYSRRTTCTWSSSRSPSSRPEPRPRRRRGGRGRREPAPRRPSARSAAIELHEVKTLNKHLARLRDEFGLRAEVLLPAR